MAICKIIIIFNKIKIRGIKNEEINSFSTKG